MDGCLDPNEILPPLRASLSHEVANIESSLEKLLKNARQLMAISQDFRKIRNPQRDHLMSLLNNYNERVRLFLGFFKEVSNENVRFESDTLNDLVILLYDEMLMILMLAFSICDYSHLYMFDPIFKVFLIKNGLIRPQYDDLELERIMRPGGRGGRLFSPYDFPVIFSMFLKSQDRLKQIFAAALNLTREECEGEIQKFTDSIIYLMGIRNQIAHMSKDKQLYSIEKIRLNWLMLARYFSAFQSNLERLMVFFYSLADELKTEGILTR